jgi:sugar lactone lactonase YvrE
VPRTIRAEPILSAAAHLAEGPVWDARRGVLLWVDILAGALHHLDPQTGVDVAVDVGQPIGSLAHRAQGGAVAALRDGFAELDLDTGSTSLIVPVEPGCERHVMNDGGCDPAGRFWAGTMSLDVAAGAGGLYCLAPDGSCRQVLAGVTASNGIGWSGDGRTMYYVDSFAGGVDRFAFDPAAGEPTARQRFVGIDEGPGIVPDGLAVDADGHVWIAVWGSGTVRRHRPDGTLDTVVEVPGARLVTNCAFGGAALDTLFITTAVHDQGPDALAGQPHAGAIFVAHPGVAGQPAALFGG